MDTDLVTWMGEQFDVDEKSAQWLMRFAQDTQLTFEDHRKWLGREVPGWHSWPDVEALCGRTLAEITAKRAILADCEYYIVNDEVAVTDGLAGRVVSLLAQLFAGRPGWREEWATQAG